MDTMTVPCRLTETELDERRDKLAALVAEKESVECEKKLSASKYKERLDRLDVDQRLIANEIKERAEWRPVEIVRRKDWVREVEETIRCDTGEVVNTRHLTPAERQRELEYPSTVGQVGAVSEN